MAVTNHTIKMTEEQIVRLAVYLESTGWEFGELAYAFWRARKDKTTVAAYNSGKVVFQGKGTEDLIRFYVEPEVTKEARFGYEKELSVIENSDQLNPHCGIDESGKGDFFGPLVTVCAFTDETTAPLLLKLGVTDSKTIKSDVKIRKMAVEIRKVLKGSYSVVSMSNETYNRLYAKIGNLNKLLSWAHARSLESLLEKVPSCPKAISDQFSKKGISSSLMEKGRKIQLIEMTKAESDIAVATASILARDLFVQGIGQMREAYGMEFPKGATNVKTAGVDFVRRNGVDSLAKVAKLHFKTAEEVINLSKS